MAIQLTPRVPKGCGSVILACKASDAENGKLPICSRLSHEGTSGICGRSG